MAFLSFWGYFLGLFCHHAKLVLFGSDYLVSLINFFAWRRNCFLIPQDFTRVNNYTYKYACSWYESAIRLSHNNSILIAYFLKHFVILIHLIFQYWDISFCRWRKWGPGRSDTLYQGLAPKPLPYGDLPLRIRYVTSAYLLLSQFL